MANPRIGDYAGMPHRRGGPHRTGTQPSPAKRASITRYLRCTACGARRREDAFRTPYRLAAWLLAAGGYKGIRWTDAPLTDADRDRIASALRAAIKRIA